jgi:predicted transcriptional regulator of viral defense system
VRHACGVRDGPGEGVCSKNHDSGGKSSTPQAEEAVARLEAAVARVAAAVARVAARQHGMVTRVQLLGLGLSAREIDYRLATGRLWRVHRGVYAVGHRPPSPHARAMAAVLACGPGAVLSHRSAAALWAMGVRWPADVEVTAPVQRQRNGIRVHRSRTLTRRDVTRQFGIPVTTPARTLLDLADQLDHPSLTRAVNEARLAHRSTLPELAELLTRSPGRTTRRLRPFVEADTGPTRSRLEDAFLAFAAKHGLPTPEVNQIVAGHEVDMLWREHRIIVELDSRDHHEHAFEEDRDRDATLLDAGFPVLRITWRRLTGHPAREAARLRSILDHGVRSPAWPNRGAGLTAPARTD